MSKESAGRDRYIELLQESKRPGIDSLIIWLSGTDFFINPASSKFHNAYPGGLCDHSLSVYGAMRNFCKVLQHLSPGFEPTNESIIITSLLHDICKCDEYAMDTRNKKDETGKWVSVPFYKTAMDTFPIGHGEKSVILAMHHIRLTTDEIVAIRQHMGAFGLPPYGSINSADTVSTAYEKFPLALALSFADQTSSYLMEIQGEVPL